MAELQDTQVASEAPPHPGLQSLDRLVGTWTLSGETQGQVTYEWMEGGYFLLQHVDIDHDGHRVRGMEVIGQLRLYGEESGADIKSRYYGSTGETFDYVYEVVDDTFTIWAGERGSPAYYQGTFSEDGATCAGAWVFPGGGGYTTTMTRVVP